MLKRPEPFFFEHGDCAVILLHAYSGSANDVRLLARSLERENYSIYAPQFSGHGTGDLRDVLRQGSPAQWWQDTQQAISFVRQKGYTKISIFGLSLGGIFATMALENDPALLGGGVFSSPILPSAHTQVPEMFMALCARQFKQQGLSSEAQKQALAAIKPDSQAQLQAITQFTITQVQALLTQLTRPFFIGQGGQDELIDATVAPRLRDQLMTQGLTVDYHWFADAGHVITVNQAHHALEQAVLTYLKTIY
ncbi:alpha/beta fold hydrolase [Lactiplantibacillus sp. WILCCON 0030]|uniref:Alpha/beta fold hydrolase n=1 Tax=Lactiplantibacillus brownii TaxID=3069269 RepID=A0ABU1A6R9_9LACO|nr:alpha/beta fold hydrolase [Lactiplantibacillus brownii]MDQ7936623.1 alpha/beta fold hydrolase [Lactiplantibacillus brownii]